jgi:hypothetical protein
VAAQRTGWFGFAAADNEDLLPESASAAKAKRFATGLMRIAAMNAIFFQI